MASMVARFHMADCHWLSEVSFETGPGCLNCFCIFLLLLLAVKEGPALPPLFQIKSFGYRALIVKYLEEVLSCGPYIA